jgi:hypothetical protein
LAQSVAAEFATPKNNETGIADQRKRHGPQERKQRNPSGILPVFAWLRPDGRSMLDRLRQRERAA